MPSSVFGQQNWMRLSPATAGWVSIRLARVVAIGRSEIGDGALDDDERAESLELRADEAYARDSHGPGAGGRVPGQILR